MRITDLIIKEARPKIAAEAEIKLLTRWLKRSGLWSEFRSELQAVRTLDELEQLENRIYDRISSSAI